MTATRSTDHSSLADAELMARLAAGDEAALGAIWDRHADVVYGSVLRFLGDRQVTEEVVQDAFLVVWRQASRYDASTGSMVGWLLRIARNKAIDRLRMAARRPAILWLGTGGDRRDGDPWWDVATMIAGGGPVDPGPEELVTRQWSRAVVRTALSAMPESERRMLELAYDEELTQVEIGQRLGWPLGTVKSRTRRALATLRTVLEGVPGLVERQARRRAASPPDQGWVDPAGGTDAPR